MEKYSASCRFILACNEISKILDPIQSRCVIFKFKPLNESNLLELLGKIEKNEEIKIDEDAKELLVRISGGDTRKLINTLQASSSIAKSVTKKLIEEVMDFVDPQDVRKMLDYAIDGDFFKARDSMIKLKTIKGLSALEILKEIYRQVILMDIDAKVKIKTIDRIATVEFRIVEGSDEEIQLEALLAMMSLIKS
jgi:replication factor C small subunit